MYTTINLGRDLKEILSSTSDIQEIATWAFNDIYMEHCREMDRNTSDCVHAIGLMEMGPEFEYTIEELHNIADRLIAGEEVDLYSRDDSKK